jgi:hypothetical protein
MGEVVQERPLRMEVTKLRGELFERVLGGLAPHALLLARVMGKYSKEALDLSPNTAKALSHPDVGMLSVPIPLSIATRILPDGLFSVWAIPGELRVGLLLAEDIERVMWATRRPEQKLLVLLGEAWAGGTCKLGVDPGFCVQRHPYAGGGGTMYDWRFVDATIGFDAWCRALEGAAPRAVWLDAIEARIRHIWFAASRILARAGFHNRVLLDSDSSGWIVQVDGEGQPDIVWDAITRLGLHVRHAVPSSVSRWMYVVRGEGEPEKVTDFLGAGYRVDVKRFGEMEEIVLQDGVSHQEPT